MELEVRSSLAPGLSFRCRYIDGRTSFSRISQRRPRFLEPVVPAQSLSLCRPAAAGMPCKCTLRIHFVTRYLAGPRKPLAPLSVCARAFGAPRIKSARYRAHAHCRVDIARSGCPALLLISSRSPRVRSCRRNTARALPPLSPNETGPITVRPSHN